MKNNIMPDNKGLDFQKNVVKYFHFLTDNYKFKIIINECNFIQYETDDVFLNVYHGRQSYEVGIECGLKCYGYESRFRLPIMLLGLLGESAKKIQSSFQASNKEAVLNCMAKLAKLLDDHCSLLLYGDQKSFALVAKASTEESQILNEIYSINPINEQADHAWKYKDYKQVVALYDSIYNNLTSFQVSRLKYAKKIIQLK